MKRALLIFLAILALSGIAYAAEQVIRGDLTVTGDFSVTGDTIYTGDLIVKGGDLAVGEAGTEPGDIVLHDAGTIIMYDDGNDTSFIWGPVANGTTTLGGTGNLDISGTIDAGTMTLGSGSITDSSGAISFGDENLSTTGTLAGATLNTGQGAYELYAMNQDMETTDSPTFVTAKLSGLTDTYIPYHVADATGLADSPLKRTDANTVTLYGADPALVFDGSTATDTDFWVGVTADEDGVDDDKLQIGDGTTPGTNPFVTIDTSGNVGIGITAPNTKLDQAQFSADAVGSYHTFSKSRHATPGSHTVVQDNDVIGGINFAPSDGTDFGTVSAQIKAEVDDAAPAASSIGGALVFSTAAGTGADDLTERMRIAAAGGVFLSTITASTGVLFGSDTAAANTLDDYEEGYTSYNGSQIITCSISGNYVASTNYTLKYTKTGDIVHVHGVIEITSDNSPNGTIKVNLPFTSANLTQLSGYATGAIYLVNGGAIAGKLYPLLMKGVTYFTLRHIADAGTYVDLTNADVDTAWTIVISLFYTAS